MSVSILILKLSKLSLKTLKFPAAQNGTLLTVCIELLDH